MSTLQEEITRLRTLQESYSELAAKAYPTTEVVTVNLYLPDGASVDWTRHAITVFDNADNKQYVYEINADGTCTFEIPSGHTYAIGYPQLASYAKPKKQSFAATLYKRHIVYEYAQETSYETLRVRVIDGMSQSSIDVLNGQTVVVIDSDGVTYTGVVNGSACDIQIPFGKNCTLVQQPLEGYRAESGNQEFETGLSLRVLTLKYTLQQYGLFGMDEDGNLYTIEEIEAMEDKTIIKYGAYNDSDLAMSSRVDSGVGNGFCWIIGGESLGSKQWAMQNVEFDVTRLPFYSNLNDMKYAGLYMTKTIQDIGLELFPDNEDPTPAATACLNKTIMVGGETKRGFLPAYDQILRIATTNRTLFQALYSALGRVAPTLWSGGWWTSCQNNATTAVLLGHGGFRNNGKTDSNTVLCCFDLQIVLLIVAAFLPLQVGYE